MKAFTVVALCLCAAAAVSGGNRSPDWSERQTREFRVEGATVVGVPLPTVLGQGVKISQTVKITRQSQFTWILQCSDISVKELRNELSDAGGQSGSSSSESSSSQQDSSSSSSSSSSEESDAQIEDAIRKVLETPIEIIVEGHRVKHINVQKGTPRWARNIFRGLVTQFHVVFEQYEIKTGGKSGYEVVDHLLFGKCPTEEDVRDIGQVKALNSNTKMRQEIEEAIKDMGFDVEGSSSSSSSSSSESQDTSSSSSQSSSSEEWNQRIPKMLDEITISSQASKICRSGDSIYVMMKKVRLGDCEKMAALDMGHPALELNNSNPLYERKVALVSVGCGMGRESFKTLAIVAADILNIGMQKASLPSLKQITYQVASIKDVYPATHVPQVEQKESIQLQYEFASWKEQRDGQSVLENPIAIQKRGRILQASVSDSNSDSNSDSDSSSDSSSDSNASSNSDSNSDSNSSSDESSSEELDEAQSAFKFGQLSKQQRVQRIRDLLREITKYFYQNKSGDAPLNVRKIMMKYRLVIRLIRTLPREELRKLHGVLVIEGKRTETRGLYTLYFNALLIAGTGPSLSLCDQFARESRIETVQTLHYLLSVPKYIRFPTKAFILRFKKTVEQLSSNQQYHQAGLMSLASLTYQACVNSRVAEAKFPTEVAGPFCNVGFAEQEVSEYLLQKLQGVMATGNDQQKATLLAAIGILGVPSSARRPNEVVNQLQRIIQDNSNKHSTYIRVKAVFAYKRLIQSEQGNDAVSAQFVKQTVLPQLLAVFENSKLPSPVQMAAAPLIFLCEHSTTQHWSQVAQAATASNGEIQKFVSTSFLTMAKMQKPISENHKRMKEIAQKMTIHQNIQENSEQVDEEFKSLNLYTAEEIGEDSELGFYGRFALLHSYRRNDFKQAFLSGSYILGQDSLDLTPIALTIASQRNSNGVDQQKELFAQINLWNEIFVHAPIDSNTLYRTLAKTEIGRMVKIWFSETQENSVQSVVYPLNVQKAIQPWEQLREVPTILGFPVSFRMNTPVIFSVVGNSSLKGTGPNRRVVGEFYLSAVGQLKTRLTAKIPYTMKYYQVGYEKNVAVELPIRIVVQKPAQGAIQIAVTPTHLQNNGKPQGEVRLFSLDVLPYTAIIQDPWATTLKEKFERFDVIRTGEKQKTRVNFGEDLGMKFTYSSQYDQRTESTEHWRKFLYQDRNLTVDFDASSTNTFLFTLGRGRAAQLQQSSGSSSDSNSEDSSDSQQGNSVEQGTDIKHGEVLALALTCKSSVIQRISQRATTTQELDGPSNKCQYLFEIVAASDSQAGFVRVATGEAANQAAKTLPQEGGLREVRDAITQSPNNGQQASYCFELDHQNQENGNDQVLEGKTDVRYGQDCSNLQKVPVESVIEAAGSYIKVQVEAKHPERAPRQLKAVVEQFQRMLQRAHTHAHAQQSHQSGNQQSALKMQVEPQALRAQLKYNLQHPYQQQHQQQQSWQQSSWRQNAGHQSSSQGHRSASNSQLNESQYRSQG